MCKASCRITKPKCYFVQQYVSSALKSLGASAGKHPLLYCLVPLFVAALLSVRIYWVHLTKEVEYLYSPINGRAMKERDAIESIFPPNSDGIDAITLTRFRRLATLLVEAKDGGSILREDILRDVMHVDTTIQKIIISHQNKNYSYTDLCSKQHWGNCQHNDVLDLRGKTNAIKKKRLLLRYPAHLEPFNQQLILYAIGLGAVTVDENDYILDAKALRLVYILNYTTAEKDAACLKWIESFQEVTLQMKFEHIEITIACSESIDNEISRVTEMTLPLLLPTGVIMGIFAVLSCMTKHWITSKPWVAIAGCISPILGTAVAFSLLLICGVEYVDVNVIIVFLLVGIGLDDSFMVLAAWRRTDPRDEVISRMSQAYEDAGVPITITSITNILSLCIGLMTSYRIVRLFCTYIATSLVFAYIYQITFFGGVLALSGYREKRNMHPLLFIVLKEESIPCSPILKLIYVGWSNEDTRMNSRSNNKSKFLENVLTIITSAQGKCFVLASFLVYLVTSGYCLQFVKEGFDYRDAMRFDSFLAKYFTMHNKYFVQHPHPIHIVINKTLDYSDKQVQKDIEDILQNFCNIPYMSGSNLTVSWLKYYLQSTEESLMQFSYRGYNMSQSNDFIAGLRDVFLKFPHARIFRENIRFNRNKTQIVASRFIVLSKNVDSSQAEKKLLSTMFSKADSCKYPLNVYNIWFPLYSILLNITSTTIETLLTAVATVTVVFFIFTPHILSAIGIIATIVSIEIGVIGFMSIWNVPLDAISMMCLIMSVGLSVDYTAHVSYAYISCKEEDPNEKTRKALLHTGYPIIQGCVSTLLGVVVLGFGPSNVFLVFFKVISLVMMAAIFHGLFVIPVMLNIFETMWNVLHNRCQKTNRNLCASNNDECKYAREEIYLTE